VRVQDEPIPSLETSAQDKKSSWLGSSSTPSRKGGRPPEVQTPLQKSFDELSSCGDAGQGKKIGPVPRLITNFPELRNLFGAVVAHNQSEELGRDDGFGTTGGKSAENPNSINSSDQAMRIREDAPRQRLDIGHISPEVSRLSPRARVSAERIAYSGRHDVEGGRNEVPEAGIADARWNYRLPGATPVVATAAENNPAPIFQNPWSDSRRPSLSNEGVAARLASNLQDLGWEEVLFDRLLIRWEERLREQAIRHSGFTGGLI
jgi:hypothetical protein